MELKSTQVQPNKLLTIDKLRRNYSFMKFYLLPAISSFKNDLRWMSEKISISIEEAFSYQEELFANGLWLKVDSGNIILTEDFLETSPEFDQNEKVLGFLISNANLAAQISYDGPCWFEYSTITTNEELRKEFLTKIDSAYKEFISKSNLVKGTELVSWSHIFIDALDKNQNKNQEVQ